MVGLDLPVLAINVFQPGVEFRVGKYTVRATPMNHPVESMAMPSPAPPPSSFPKSRLFLTEPSG